MDEIVPALANSILHTADRHFAFYGHSMGAKIAFETARFLRRQACIQPYHLFVGASDAPQLPWRYPPMHHLPEDEFIRGIEQRYGGVPKQILADPELRALLIPTLRADVQLVETYSYVSEPPLDCSITAFGGTTDGTLEWSAIESWRHQTAAGFQLREIIGGHFFVSSAQAELTRLIAEEMSAYLPLRRGAPSPPPGLEEVQRNRLQAAWRGRTSDLTRSSH